MKILVYKPSKFMKKILRILFKVKKEDESAT